MAMAMSQRPVGLKMNLSQPVVRSVFTKKIGNFFFGLTRLLSTFKLTLISYFKT